ncbi:MAG: pitrilysin family protein [Candidatus Aenigmatarchaeota archaeon]
MKIETLDNGIKIYKIKKNSKNIGLGIGVNIGSIYEEVAGISHFLEHMMFKSNKKYSAKQIDEGLELNGAIANAYTSTFLTFYAIEMLPKNFEKIVDILFSMFENEKFKDEEFEKEKKVVISEIERYESNPEDLLEIKIPFSVYGNSDYGRPIAGYRESIENLSKEELEEFKLKHYVSKNMFIIIEGNFNSKHLKILKKYFSKIREDKSKLKKPKKSKGENVFLKLNTKNQIYYSKSIRLKNKKLFEASALSFLISGGISSRIFQIFRNKYGIGYRVSSEITYIYPDEFIFSILVPGFEKDKEKFLENAEKELLNFEEIEKEYIKGRINRQILEFEKEKQDIFKRLILESKLIKLFNLDFESFEKKVLSLMEEINKLEKIGKKLLKGNIVKILPNDS